MCNSQKESGPPIWKERLDLMVSVLWKVAGIGLVGVFIYFAVTYDSKSAWFFLFASILFFIGFLCDRAIKSEEDREETNAMFPIYSFVLGIMASIVPNIISPEKLPEIKDIREPLGLFIITLLWQLVLFYKLDVKKSMELKKRKSRQLTLIVNGETFTLVDKDGKPICLPPPDEKERETD